MAFAVTSLLEYYFHDGVRLSPQYLYACCKHEEQDDGKGTTLETAFKMVVEHGFCKETDWPYNNQDLPANHEGDAVENEMQIKPNRLKELDKLANVSCWDIKDRFHEFYTPSSVEECKAALRGDGGRHSMPVVIGCKVFPSFTERANPDDWIPKPDEYEHECDKGHAMLVTGYQDTPYPDFSSKGYFWALNSWGPSIHDDPKHIGMVKIPYEYYAQYVMEAGTIREKLEGNNTGYPISQDTPTACKTTVTKTNQTNDPQPPSAVMINLSDTFFASLETNLNRSSYKLPYDLFQIKPWIRHSAKPMPPQDVSKLFMGFVRENSKSDHALQATIKVYPLCKDSTFRLVAATLSHDDGVPISTANITLLRDFIRRRLAKNGFHDILVIAANIFTNDVQPLLSPPVFLCSNCGDGLWDYHLPKVAFSEESIEFLLHALPGSSDAYADRLAALIKYWPKTTYCTKNALRPELALHPSIPDVFFDHWLNALFDRASHSKNKNDWYAKDDRGVIYPPGAELPEGHGAKRIKRFS